MGIRNLNETIQALIQQVKGIPKSKFGAHCDIKPFTAEDEAKAQARKTLVHLSPVQLSSEAGTRRSLLPS
jgi:hypothetical protein